MPPTLVRHGACHVLFAFDVGASVDLTRAREALHGADGRWRAADDRVMPRYFLFEASPLRIVTGGAPPPAAGGATRGVAAVAYDFGAVSLRYEFPFDGALEEFGRRGEELLSDEDLRATARGDVHDLLGLLGPAVASPRVASLLEDYVVLHVADADLPCPACELPSCRAEELARTLRPETVDLSAQEIVDTLDGCVTWSRDDLCLIDWGAAIVVQVDPDDVLAVLEFANAQLLEARLLDRRLDESLDHAYETLTRPARWLPGTYHAEALRVGRMQVDAAVVHDRVGNALKLLGDQHLARVYRTAARRFRLASWSESIVHRLAALDSIHAKLAEGATHRRMELLEWVIIVLIAVSILLPFLDGSH